jgi:hypothetical protein
MAFVRRDQSKATHYVDKAKLYDDMREWKRACHEAEAAGRERPQPSRYISDSMMNIVMGMSKKNNFKNYTFIDEMISDAIENLVMALPSFNPEKSNNPFGYFSIIVFYAFLRRMAREKKQTYIKYKLTENMMLHNDPGTGVEISEKKAIEDILNDPKLQDLVNKIDTAADLDKLERSSKKKRVSGSKSKRKDNTLVWMRRGT